MGTNRVVATLLLSSLTLIVSSAGCGGGREDYVMISRPAEQVSEVRRGPPQPPEASIRQSKDCLAQFVTRLPKGSHTIRYQVGMNDEGKILQVDLQNTTVEDADAEACFRKVIAAMEVPKDALELRSSRPFSGGERMNRERRGLIGSESKPGIVWLGPIILEMVGVEVIIQVGLGVIAAVATIVDTTEKNPKDKCRDHYVTCMDTPFGSMRMGEKKGASRCEWCRKKCQDNGGEWPLIVEAVVGQRSCKYW